MTNEKRWFALLGLNALAIVGMITWQSQAQAPAANMPFANAVAQREQMIQLLKESNEQLKEQNALLRSGKLKVQLVEK
ncbi:hypothetical protein [Blastopirellula retiformator]|uniref:Uncharacterized protein n=1 Tax=Blastopirellula retiformator TaxID=2527970 RepID=A0A5C5V0B4_9BACT|nr:hypothetical protein [Blastopirellula retiformator]TWT31383.1 hypothetical protein Enr8_33040 [Blastopirellula retiformator]